MEPELRSPGGLAHLLLGLCLLAVACAVNPVTRQREVVFVSEEEEVRLGEEAAEQVSVEMGIVEDPRVSAYVSAVGERVAAAAPERPLSYRFQIVDMQEPNAFALPGGHVYVSRGILAIANDEDELANVIAHEVVHVAARHHAQRHARATGVGILALPGRLAGALIGGPVGGLVSAPATLAGAGALASYSRDQEFEADRYGQEIAARAGYDPRALWEFLGTLERESRLRSEEDREPSWLDSHPSTPKRASRAAERGARLEVADPRPVAADREAFLRRIEGLLVGENPAEGVFQGQRFLHPDLNLTLVFPEGWTTANSRAAVGAVSPPRDAQVVLEHAGQGSDPREAASEFFQEAAKHVALDVARLEPLRVGGLDAVRGQAVVRGDPVVLDLTWIAYGGSVYRITGVVPRGYGEGHRATFGAVVESFRPLTPAERGGIREWRLALERARAGETLEGFCRRTGNAWSPSETAVANGLPDRAVLEEGRLLKLARPRAYAGR